MNWEDGMDRLDEFGGDVGRLGDDTLDRFVRSSAVVTDVELTPLADAPAAKALFEGIASTPYPGVVRGRRAVLAGWTRHATWRRRLAIGVAVTAAMVAMVVLAVPEAGVLQSVPSWLSGGHGPDFPHPTGEDVVLASGVAGIPWRIIATPSDQGLCVFLVFHDPAMGTGGPGGCGLIQQPVLPGDAPGSLHHVTGSDWGGYDASLNRLVSWGWATQDVASVDLVLTAGGTVQANLIDTPAGVDAAPRFFWAALPCPPTAPACGADGPGLVRELVARNAAGDVIERRDVSGSPKDESLPPR